MVYEFNLQHSNQILDHFNRNGYVIIKDVLTKDECTQTTSEIQEVLQQKVPGFSFQDQESYPLLNNHLTNYGLPGKVPIFTPQMIKNRINPNIHQAFKLLYQDDKPLLVNHDRFAFYRPTLEHPEWKTPYTYPNLHLDMDPKMYLENSRLVKQKRLELDYSNPRSFITENNLNAGTTLQGIINIWDNMYNDGGLQLVPGFHKNFIDWYSQKHMVHQSGVESLWKFDHKDPTDMQFLSKVIRIPMSAGSIAIWNKRLAHGSFPNNSMNGRLIQFILMQKRNAFPVLTLKNRKHALMKELKKINFEPDFVGASLLF